MFTYTFKIKDKPEMCMIAKFNEETIPKPILTTQKCNTGKENDETKIYMQQFETDMSGKKAPSIKWKYTPVKDPNSTDTEKVEPIEYCVAAVGNDLKLVTCSTDPLLESQIFELTEDGSIKYDKKCVSTIGNTKDNGGVLFTTTCADETLKWTKETNYTGLFIFLICILIVLLICCSSSSSIAGIAMLGSKKGKGTRGK